MGEKQAYKNIHLKNSGIKNTKLFITAAMAFLFFVLPGGGASAAIPINNCGPISSPGTYVLVSDVIAKGMGFYGGGVENCVIINSKDVVLDGANYQIGSSLSVGFIGVIVEGSPNNPLTNVTIKNLHVKGWSDAGIRVRYSSGVTLFKNTLENNGLGAGSHGGIHVSNSNNVNAVLNTVWKNYNGIVLEDSNNNNLNANFVYCSQFNAQGQAFNPLISSQPNTCSLLPTPGGNDGYGIILVRSANNIMTNNIVSFSNEAGIFFSPSSGSNTIYNNVLNNINNVAGYANDNNIWSIARAEGTNIVGGPYIGGNVWLNPGVNGFSLTCSDSDSDGICDQPYKLDNNNIDYLPLTGKPAAGPTVTPAPAPIASPDVSSCTTISSPGEYTLKQDIIDSSAAGCINIASSNVVLNGAGYRIDGTNSPDTAGIYVFNSTAILTNITIKNLKVTDWNTGILLVYSNGVTLANNIALNNNFGIGLIASNGNLLANNTASLNQFGFALNTASNNNLINNLAGLNQFGIILAVSSNNDLTNNHANLNGAGIILNTASNNNLANNFASLNLFGIILSNSSSNTIYNNYFNNTNNSIFVNPIFGNYWNTTKIPGTNINGGPNLGGNFWAYPNGTGFSQTCIDGNSDGICDSAYVPDSSNIDYLPLALETSGVKGDINSNEVSGDAGDLVLMKRASIGEIQTDSKYDLNDNGQIADAGDLVLMKRASIGEINL